MPEQFKPTYLERDDVRGDIQIWIVDDSYIRGRIDEEFTTFSQHYRYSYIPNKEFCIDQEAEHDALSREGWT